MAKYVVGPKPKAKDILIKCERCGTLYSPEKTRYGCLYTFYEDCPECGYDCNTDEERIFLWQYNLIKFMRGGFREEK